MKKLLFFCNTIAESRYCLFKEISKLFDTTFIVSDMDLSKKIYGNGIHESEISELKYLSQTVYDENIKTLCRNADYILVQPPDSFKEIMYAYKQVLLAKKFSVPTALFWERWSTLNSGSYLPYRIKCFIHDFLVRPLIRRIDKVLASGSKTKEYCENLGVQPEKITIVGDCSALPPAGNNNIRTQFHIGEDAFVFLSLGRLIQIKGNGILIKAFIEYLKESKNDNAFLIISGDGPCKNLLENQVPKNCKNVIFTGYVSPTDRTDYFNACNAFVLPSYFHKGTCEAWGLTVNEALMCGKPVLTTDAVGAGYEMITDDTGILVKSGSVSEMKSAVAAIISRTYSSDIIKSYAEEFSAEKVAENICRAFAEKC